MESHLITVDGSEPEVTPENVKRLLESSARFWLDLAGLDGDTTTVMLRDTFGFHPLAVEDAEHFGQRPKLDSYDDYTVLVVYGAGHGFLLDEYAQQSHAFKVVSPVPLLAAR